MLVQRQKKLETDEDQLVSTLKDQLDEIFDKWQGH